MSGEKEEPGGLLCEGVSGETMERGVIDLLCECVSGEVKKGGLIV